MSRLRMTSGLAAAITMIFTVFVGAPPALAQDSLTIGGRATLVDQGVRLNAPSATSARLLDLSPRSSRERSPKSQRAHSQSSSAAASTALQ